MAVGVAVTMLTDVASELEGIDDEIAQARKLMRLALDGDPPDAAMAERVLAKIVELEAERTKWRMAEHNVGIVVAGAQQEGRHRKTSAERTQRLCDLGVHIALSGDSPAAMQVWADKWDITESQARQDRAELWRHAGGAEGRQEAAALCDNMLRLSASVQTELARGGDPYVRLKAAEGLVRTSTALARLHSLGTQSIVDITIRPFQDLPEDVLQARLAASAEGVVIDLPT